MSNKLVLIEHKEIAQGTVEVVFQKPAAFTYLAGQNINLKLAELKYEDPKGPRRTFTLASAPCEETLFIATRMTGSGYKKTLVELAAGTECEYIGPQGKFIFDSKVKKAVLLAGGIGITPFRSMLREAQQNNALPETLLIYSNANLAGTAFHNLFIKIADENASFQYVPILTNLTADDPWAGERRLMSMALIQEIVPDWLQATFFLCGSPPMVTAMTEQLQQAGILPANIRSESLWGY